MFASKISLRGLDGREEEDLRARLSKFFATQIDEVVLCCVCVAVAA